MKTVVVRFRDGYEMKVTISTDTDITAVFGKDVIIEEE